MIMMEEERKKDKQKKIEDKQKAERDNPLRENNPLREINPLRGLEDLIEQNDNQLDGIINNLPEETCAEKEEKTSVLEKIKKISKNTDPAHKPRGGCPERELM